MSHPGFSTLDRGIVIFGAQGQIGSAIASQLACLPGADERLHAIDWDESQSREPVESWLGPVLRSKYPIDFVFANGLTDPKRSEDELLESNLNYPMRVMSAVSAGKRKRDRFLSLGTIHENVTALCEKNRYFNSKLKLSEWMKSQAQAPHGEGRFLHLRLHTIYGGEAKPHMFLGQMIEALRSGKPFRMSSGEQLREYHHAQDIAASLSEVLLRAWDFGPVLEISSGQPVRLAELARSVFSALGKENLLEIGSLPRAEGELIERTFPRSPDWVLTKSRDPIAGVIEYVRSELLRSPS